MTGVSTAAGGGDVAAGAAAGDLLDDGSRVGGQMGPIVQDLELAVLDDHGDDLAAVDIAEMDLDPGDHQGALAGDHAGHAQGRSGWCGCGPGEAGSVQAAAGGGWQRAGQGAGQDAAGGDDVDEVGVDAQGDALP